MKATRGTVCSPASFSTLVLLFALVVLWKMFKGDIHFNRDAERRSSGAPSARIVTALLPEQRRSD
jgi:hypothetical protein